jgi:hypothetical protein
MPSTSKNKSQYFVNQDKKKILYFFSLLCIFSAIYHAVGLFIAINNSPKWRHGVFVFVSIFCAVFFLQKNKFFLGFLVLLLLQQYYSHGNYLIQFWKTNHQIHWISVSVLLFFPIGIYVYYKDLTENK